MSTVELVLGHVGDQLEDRVHARILAEDVLKGELALAVPPRSAATSSLQGPFAQGPVDHQPQMVDVDRLGQKVVGAQADRLHRLVDAAVAGGDDDGDRQPALLNLRGSDPAR